MNDLNYKRGNLFTGPRFLGLLFLLAGVALLVIPSFIEDLEVTSRTLWIGISTIVFGLFVISTQSGTFISFDELRLKEYTLIFGFKVGEWVNISDVSHLRLAEESYTSSNTPNGISPTLSHKVTKHNILMYDTDQRLIHSIEYNEKDIALAHSKLISTQLNVRLDRF